MGKLKGHNLMVFDSNFKSMLIRPFLAIIFQACFLQVKDYRKHFLKDNIFQIHNNFCSPLKEMWTYYINFCDCKGIYDKNQTSNDGHLWLLQSEWTSDIQNWFWT